MRTEKSILLVALIFVFSTQIAQTKKEIKVLFIGNSLTYYNGMPQILQKMLDGDKNTYKVSQSTFPGISLTFHFTRQVCESKNNNTVSLCPLKPGDTSSTEKLLLTKKWDFVVLQDGTVRLLIPEVKKLQVIPIIQSVTDRHKSNVSQFVLFKTWPSLDTFPRQYCYPSELVDKSIKKEVCCSPLMKTQDEEINFINAAYDSVALATHLPTIPITNCFTDILKNHQDIKLYEDKSHPSKLGAYLNACVFYKYLTKQKASTIKYYADVDKNIAITIQSIVDKNYP